MGTFQIEPTNEIQTREWFVAHLDEFEYDIIVSRRPFPDYVLKDKDGKQVRTEVEFASANFIAHGHDPLECDLVLCWVHTANLPLPVLELSKRILHMPGKGALETSTSSMRGNKDKGKEAEEEKLRVILSHCSSEVDQFMQALIRDWKTRSQCQKIMMEPRMALFAAQHSLEGVLQESGGNTILRKWGRLHPYDLFRNLNNVVTMGK